MQRRSFLNPASLQSEMGLVPDTGARRCRALSAGHASQVIRRCRHAAPWRDRRCVGPDGRERGECDVQHGVDRRAGPSAAMLVADRALERHGVVARDQHRVTKFRRGEATVLSRTPSIAWAIGWDWLRSMTPREPDPTLEWGRQLLVPWRAPPLQRRTTPPREIRDEKGSADVKT
jgi:hypothetical protein